jgi:hypothetical protein
MAVGKDLPTKVLMAIPREPMALRGSVVGVGRAWTKNLNVHTRVAAKVTREPSICKVLQELLNYCRILTEVILQISSPVKSHAETNL